LRSVGGQPRSRKGASEHVINWPKLLLAERWVNRNKYYYELLNRLFRFLMGPKKGAEEKQYADHDLCSGKFSQRNHPKNSAMLSQDFAGLGTVIRAGIMEHSE